MTTTTTEAGSTSPAVSMMLQAIATASVARCDAWHDDAVLDATVPNWRFHARGARAVKRVFAHWFADPAHLHDVRRWPVPGGEIVEYLLTWTEDGVPHAGHHLHVLDLHEGRIARDTFFCGGRWPAGLLAEMEASDA